ncbi:MAG: c-type cytochrome [Proteobacteria bacterium]|nr:c-type cytochrome [Pseudomonadota bacterium]
MAWNPVNQKKVWEKTLPPNWNPGTMTTAGNLVFEGRADGLFVAYNATTGDELWKMNVGSGITAAPITYTVDGKQQVALMVGWGGSALLTGTLAGQHGWKYKVHPRRVITFSLDGKLPMPPSPPPAFAQPIDVPDFKVDDKLAAAAGQALYVSTCVQCHGSGVVSGGTAPDLRESPVPTSHEALKSVVVGGARLSGRHAALSRLHRCGYRRSPALHPQTGARDVGEEVDVVGAISVAHWKCLRAFEKGVRMNSHPDGSPRIMPLRPVLRPWSGVVSRRCGCRTGK